MPELPEVETIRRQLSHEIIGKKLNGKKIVEVKRRAKMLIVQFNDDTYLVFHLKLTGQLILNGQPGRFTRQVFNFSDGSRLIFNDTRRFGWFKYVKDIDNMKEMKQLGPEALSISQKNFNERLKKRQKAKIKAVLLDQKFVAGIGNIYADEILFASGVRPDRIASSLTGQEIGKIFLQMRKILQKAIKAGGSSVENYIDALGKQGNYKKYHKVYQKTGLKCVKCAGVIKRIKIGSRSSHFCPKCQH